jgi:hypothetical protein
MIRALKLSQTYLVECMWRARPFARKLVPLICTTEFLAHDAKAVSHSAKPPRR